jgi:hypothetical protein
MPLGSQSAVGIVTAGLGGAAVGLEREWSGHASGPEAHFAGIRTFTLLGGLAGVTGWLGTHNFQSAAIVLLCAESLCNVTRSRTVALRCVRTEVCSGETKAVRQPLRGSVLPALPPSTLLPRTT